MREYTILLLPDSEVGGYTVKVPTLPGLTTEGDTLEEAIENAKEAIAVYLEALEARGDPIPEERERPQILTVKVAA